MNSWKQKIEYYKSKQHKLLPLVLKLNNESNPYVCIKRPKKQTIKNICNCIIRLHTIPI